MPDCLGDQSVLLVPSRSLQVQRREPLGPLALEATSQELGEEVMVPDPLVVQRNDQ